MGSKKLSIGLKVKVEGQGEDQVTELKLDAYVFYHFFASDERRNSDKRHSMSGLIKIKTNLSKRNINQGSIDVEGTGERLILNVVKLQVANHRIGTLMSEESIAHSLYEAESLGCKRLVLKSLINQMLTLKPSQASPKNLKWDLRSKIRRQYGISDSGRYRAKTSPITPHYHLLGQYVHGIRWKFEVGVDGSLTKGL